MKAYVIVNVEVFDSALFEDYKRVADRTVEEYGGRYLVRGGGIEVLEGDWRPRRVVVVEFPTAAQARLWWNSPEYSEPKAQRQAIARTEMVIVEGI